MSFEKGEKICSLVFDEREKERERERFRLVLFQLQARAYDYTYYTYDKTVHKKCYTINIYV